VTTIYDKNGAVGIEVHCPHAGDTTSHPFITFGGAPYYINHQDQDKLVKAITELDLAKKK
jgi:hypothetical protein